MLFPKSCFFIAVTICEIDKYMKYLIVVYHYFFTIASHNDR